MKKGSPKKRGSTKQQTPRKEEPKKQPQKSEPKAKGGNPPYSILLIFRVVPENIVKKNARDAKLLKERTELRANAKKNRVEQRKLIFANAEKYYKEYQAEQQKVIDEKRKAKAAGNFYVEPSAKVALVVRTRG